MNNNYKIKAINYLKPPSLLENNLNSIKSHLHKNKISRNYDMNTFGFGEEAYIKGKNFEKKLDNFIIGSMSTEEYLLYEKKPTVLRIKKNKIVSSFHIPNQYHESNITKSVDKSFLKSHTQSIFQTATSNDNPK